MTKQRSRQGVIQRLTCIGLTVSPLRRTIFHQSGQGYLEDVGELSQHWNRGQLPAAFELVQVVRRDACQSRDHHLRLPPGRAVKPKSGTNSRRKLFVHVRSPRRG
ncbi:hypothetical protein GCM10029964_125900 [Kibdelosporangium lantanae]